MGAEVMFSLARFAARLSRKTSISQEGAWLFALNSRNSKRTQKSSYHLNFLLLFFFSLLLFPVWAMGLALALPASPSGLRLRRPSSSSPGQEKLRFTVLGGFTMFHSHAMRRFDDLHRSLRPLKRQAPTAAAALGQNLLVLAHTITQTMGSS